MSRCLSAAGPADGNSTEGGEDPRVTADDPIDPPIEDDDDTEDDLSLSDLDSEGEPTLLNKVCALLYAMRRSMTPMFLALFALRRMLTRIISKKRSTATSRSLTNTRFSK